jgi:hypothetical protein
MPRPPLQNASFRQPHLSGNTLFQKSKTHHMFLKLRLKKKVIVVISTCFLITSFTQPVDYTAADRLGPFNHVSAAIFFLGWFGFLGGTLDCFFWLAIPLCLLALYRYAIGRKGGVVPGVVARIVCFDQQ